MRSVAFGVSPGDPGILSLAVAVMFATALAACGSRPAGRCGSIRLRRFGRSSPAATSASSRGAMPPARRHNVRNRDFSGAGSSTS